MFVQCAKIYSYIQNFKLKFKNKKKLVFIIILMLFNINNLILNIIFNI